MHDFVNTSLGWFHFIMALVAMIAGTYILVKPKGTKEHRKVGYLYIFSMISLNVSALGVYNISGSFGLFHFLALTALFTLLAGMLPLLLKNKLPKYRIFHLWFMYYSVIGLYAAFASEMSVRIPEQASYTLVAISSVITFLLGSIFIYWKERAWKKYFIK